MLDKLLSLIRNPEAEVDLTDEEGHEAVAAILVEAARADGDYTESERQAIDRILARHYGISPGEAADLRAKGETAQEAALDLVQFTRAVKRAVEHEDRIGIIEAVWEVALADGDRDHMESALVRKLCGLLYVPDRESGLARMRVMQRMGRRDQRP